MKKIPILPEVVNFESIKNDIKRNFEIVVGINKDSLITEKYNFSKNCVHLICSFDNENIDSFLNAFVNQILYQQYASLVFFNSTEHSLNNPNLNHL